MRIAIDARAWDWTGVGRYIRNLIGSLMAIDDRNHYTILLGERHRPSFERLSATWPRHPRVVIVDDHYYSWREQTVFWLQLEAISADLFHFTHFNVPLGFTRPYVVTIHDTTRFMFPGQMQTGLLQQIAYEAVFARAVSRARTVICMSDTTEQELKALPFSVSSCIETIYQGVDEIFFESISNLNRQKIRMLLDTPQPYLLSVGVWMNHKNIERLLEAFVKIQHIKPELKLVITGRPKPGYINIMHLAQKMGISANVIFPGFVPHRLLPALYGEALVFVFPSLYEGFGLPPLEAAACGTPVVVGNVSSMPEVMNEAARYVNPEDVADIVRGVRTVVENSQLRQLLTDAGKERAKQYRWKTAAEKHMRVYEGSGILRANA